MKAKGVEFCYKGKEPFAVDNLIPISYLEEYSKIQDDLLSKYIDHIDNEEGSDFLMFIERSELNFTEEEINKLKSL